jgi:thymidylate synthase (FAD)
MADDITLTSEIEVEEVQAVGDDATIAAAARVSSRGWASGVDEAGRGLVRALLRNRPAHTVPFEHSLLTVRAHAPAFVWWEWTRHRFQAVDVPGLSFSLESGRYRELEPVFWVPRPGRPAVPAEGFRPMRPEFREATRAEYEAALVLFGQAYRAAWGQYRALLGVGLAREVARAVLGFGVYYAGWASGSALAWLHFLARRTRTPGTGAEGHPQAEIEEAARRVEAIFAARWPVTHAAWDSCGRVAP